MQHCKIGCVHLLDEMERDLKMITAESTAQLGVHKLGGTS